MKRFALPLLLLILASCQIKVSEEMQAMQSGFFTSQDGLQIAYDLWPAPKAAASAVVLIHMLPSNRAAWRAFAPELAKNYAVIAIDYRGRGESGGALVTEKDFQNIALDIKAAIDFVSKQENVNPNSIALIGASIGANHALKIALEDARVATAVLLSPGLDYRGVKTEDAAAEFVKPLLIVASEDDAYSASSSRTIYAAAKGLKELKIYERAGHGTDMFSQPDLAPLIVDWLKRYLG